MAAAHQRRAGKAREKRVVRSDTQYVANVAGEREVLRLRRAVMRRRAFAIFDNDPSGARGDVRRMSTAIAVPTDEASAFT